ncbi:MAG TPA: DUF6691 family protein [Rhodocyclaceae bacterium]|nr:DUF6691 family protein [Rhodocyclaceae bacterium]
MQFAIQVLSGLLFGLGLAIAGMTSPQKVLAFLDLAGHWDPSLLLVLGSAVTVSAIAFRLATRRAAPILATSFPIPARQNADWALLIGASLFGVGWGISGYCPGPAIALLAVPANPETWTFLLGLAVGYLLLATARATGRNAIQEAPLSAED